MRNHITYHWWIYLLYTLISVGIILTVFNVLQRPKADEKVVFFIGDTAVYHKTLETDMLAYLETTEENIRDVELQLADPASAGFEDLVATKALSGIDFVILPESTVKSNTGEVYFQALEDQKVYDYFGSDITLYQEEGITYGIIIDLANTNYRFSDYLSGENENTYIIFFNAFSVNLSDWNDENTTSTQALEAVRWLIEKGD